MTDDSVLLGELAEQFSRRVHEGQMPDIEEYASAHPDLAERIRELFPTLMFLEGMAGAKTATAERPEMARGSVFGNYRIERELGRGGMGIVYEAVHLALDKRVALKALLIRGGREAGQLERFFREAKTAAGLHHTNIVPVFDVGQVGGIPYYAMQYIEGRGLDAALREQQGGPPTQSLISWKPEQPTIVPTVPPQEPATDAGVPAIAPAQAIPSTTPTSADFFRWVAELGTQAAEGLAYAHQRGVIHRDIKPSNLILDQQGILWITDFGLARRKDDPSLTQPGALLGTPRYMSPEQAAAAKKPVDHRTDIYSLGASLYELLTRRPAFDGPTPTDVVLQILAREPVAPRRLNSAVPRDLEIIILKAMAKRPEDRYQSAVELAADFRRWLRLEPIHARRIGPVGRVVRWARRNPQLAAVTASATVIIVVLSGVYLQSLEQEVGQTRAALRREEEARLEAERAQREAEAARDKAEKSFEQSVDNLATSLYQQARAVRTSNQHSRRWKTLELLGSAEALRARPSPTQLEGGVLEGASGVSRSTDGSPKLPSKSELRDVAVEAILAQDGRLVGEIPAQLFGAPAALSSDGRLAALAWKELPSAKGGVRLVEIATGNELARWQTPEIDPDSFTLSPDGKLVASEVGRDSSGKSTGINLWILPERRLVKKLKWPATATNLGNAKSQQSHRYSRSVGGNFKSLLFSPTGLHLAALNFGGPKVELVLWEMRSGVGKVLAAGDQLIPFVTFSSDGKHLAVASGDEKVTILNLRDEKRVEISLPSMLTPSMSFLPNHDQFVVVCLGEKPSERAMIFWDLAKNKMAAKLKVPMWYSSPPIAFNCDGSRLAMGNPQGDVVIADAYTLQESFRIHSAHRGTLLQILWCSDGSRLVSQGFDGSLKLWQLVDKPLVTSELTDLPISGFAYSPDGRWLATASWTGSGLKHLHDEVRLINRAEGKIEWKKSMTYGTTTLVFRADSKQLGIASQNEGLLCDIPSGKEVGRIVYDDDSIIDLVANALSGQKSTRRGGYVSGGAFDPAGRFLLSHWDEKGIAVVSVNERREIWRTAEPRNLSTGFLSSDGRTLITYPLGFQTPMEMSLWDIRSGNKKTSLRRRDSERVGIEYEPIMNPDGRWLASFYVANPFASGPLNGENPTCQMGVTVWNLPSSSIRLDIRDPNNPVACRFSPSGELLAIGYSDGSVQFWHLESREKLFSWKAHSQFALTRAFSPDGAFLASTDGRTPGIQVLHLAELRKELAKIGLDW
jgi:serine/threonine protein kinase/WD40 repeat protein